MTDATADTAPKRKKGLVVPLLSGLVLAALGGGAGYLAVGLGLIGGEGEAEAEAGAGEEIAPLDPASFLPLDPIVINLPPDTGRDYLRFTAQLEVAPDHLEEVESITPRIIDVLNGYLRAIDLAELEGPSAMVRLRAQMLRRVQVVTGEGRVRDLLVMEFLLN